jgi:diguanylate cyclase (GGDEF)-like protein
MLEPGESVEPAASLRQAAELMAASGRDFLPVLEKGSFEGLVTSLMLLSEVGRTWDPMTGLPWSDRLREWGVEKLREGFEVLIVFVDLDDFGQYNKRYGHVVGDRVLKRVAELLREYVAEPEEILVRFGGDEFAIGTTRPRSLVDKLVADLEDRAETLAIDESAEPISFSAGTFGGRRTHERENVHYAATLDNLINLASKDAQARKAERKAMRENASEAASGASGADIAVIDVGADDSSPRALTTVMLSRGEAIVSGVHARGTLPLIESVVHATAKAVEKLLHEVRFVLQDVRLAEDPSGGRTVAVSGRVIGSERESSVTGARRIEADLYLATAQATLDAVLSALPANS